jgi:hypothetical protein
MLSIAKTCNVGAAMVMQVLQEDFSNTSLQDLVSLWWWSPECVQEWGKSKA